MKHSFLKTLFSFLLLVGSAAVVVFGLLFFQTSSVERRRAPQDEHKALTETNELKSILSAPSGVTPTNGTHPDKVHD